MHRRDFIAGVGFAALAGGGIGDRTLLAQRGSPAQPPQPTPTPSSPAALPTATRTLRKAVGIGMVNDPAAKTTHDKFQLLRDCGFEGIEIDWPCATPLDEFAAAQEKTGLKIHGLVDSQHWKHTLNHGSETVRRKGLDALTDCLRTAKTLGASSILLVPGIVNSDNPYDDCWRLSQEQIRLALPVARETGITIAVENVWNGFLLSPLEAARYVDELNEGAADSPVAFHFDIGNIINAGWPHHWVRILGPRIAKLHIKDFSRKKRDDLGLWKGFDVELGEGDAQWPKVMTALDACGYSTAAPGNGKGGWATAEVGGGNRTRLQQIAGQMDHLFTL
ncbi:MAG: sugar phosphate isomerase/epimerase family protein [Phycisphaerales bacterium]|nr:sugar phosphate isomerase/epimerase family protein [Phycisphaerales bacterium]